MKKLYVIKHIYDVDGGFGDAVTTEDVVGHAYATKEEIEKYIEQWDKCIIYDHPYCYLYMGHVVAEEVEIQNLNEIVPYNREDFHGYVKDGNNIKPGVEVINLVKTKSEE